MRFRKNVPAEHREFLQEQLKQYKKEITMSKDELRELEKWVASGRSPYDNGDYIYSENGCPMDFVSAMRFQDEMYEWWMSLSEEEREQELRELRGDSTLLSLRWYSYLPVANNVVPVPLTYKIYDELQHNTYVLLPPELPNSILQIFAKLRI